MTLCADPGTNETSLGHHANVKNRILEINLQSLEHHGLYEFPDACSRAEML